jgi:hypothetical protein
MSVKNNLTNLNEALYLAKMLSSQLEQVVAHSGPGIVALSDCKSLVVLIERNIQELRDLEPKPDLTKMS